MTTKMNYYGYHNENELPIKAGMSVKVPVGTLYECRGELVESKRVRSVKVDHVLPGQSFAVGYFRHASGEVHFAYSHKEDPYTVKRFYGTDNLMELWPMMTVVDYGHYSTIFLPITNPAISWVGRGGYWCRADINQFDF